MTLFQTLHVKYCRENVFRVTRKSTCTELNKSGPYMYVKNFCS